MKIMECGRSYTNLYAQDARYFARMINFVVGGQLWHKLYNESWNSNEE